MPSRLRGSRTSSRARCGPDSCGGVGGGVGVDRPLAGAGRSDRNAGHSRSAAVGGASHHVEGHGSAGVDRSGVGDGYGSGQRIASAARYRRREDRVGALPHGQPSSARIDDRHGQATGIYTGVAATISALLAVGVAGFAGYFALQGRITVGELITVVGLAQFIIEPLGLLASIPGYFAVARASSDRLALVLDAEHCVARVRRPNSKAPT